MSGEKSTYSSSRAAVSSTSEKVMDVAIRIAAVAPTIALGASKVRDVTGSTLSKLLNCGLSVTEVIGMRTSRPALAIRRPELGQLGVGMPADITVLRQSDCNYVFKDVVGAMRQGSTPLQPVAVYCRSFSPPDEQSAGRENN